MDSIKRIELTNFQSHSKTIIEPAPAGQLTVITGQSDSGKTAVIRALKWFLYNQPQGDEFTRIGCSMARVTLDYADGQTAVRERTRGTNRYKIIRPGASEPEVFEGFSGGVPLEVQDLTGVRTVRIADQDLMLNLSEQLDGPFLGQKSTSSPGRAKILGKLAGTEEIDLAGAETGRDIYRRGQDEKRLAEEIGGLTERLAEFDYLEDMGRRIEAAERVIAGIRGAQNRLATLEHKRDGLLAIRDQEDEARGVVARWIGVEAAEKAVALIELYCGRHERLSMILARLQLVNLDTLTAQTILSKLAGLEKAAGAAARAEAYVHRTAALRGLQVKAAQVDSGIALSSHNLKKLLHVERAGERVKGAETAAVRREKLAALAAKLSDIEAQEPKLIQKAAFYGIRVEELKQDYICALADAKICPLCGQGTAGLKNSELKEVV